MKKISNYKLCIYTLLLSLSWTLPFVILGTISYFQGRLSYSYEELFYSYAPFLVLYTITIILSFIFSEVLNHWKDWNSLSFFIKYTLLGVSYTLSVLLFIITIIFGPSANYEYFGGDPEGSILMLTLPTILIYFVAGVFAVILNKILNRFMENKRRTEIISVFIAMVPVIVVFISFMRS